MTACWLVVGELSATGRGCLCKNAHSTNRSDCRSDLLCKERAVRSQSSVGGVLSYERPWVGKRRNFNAQNVIAIAAATALGVAAMTTSAVAGCGGGGGHGGGSGGRFAGGGGLYAGCSDRGHGRGLGAGIVGICAVGNSVHRSAARCARHRAAYDREETSAY